MAEAGRLRWLLPAGGTVLALAVVCIRLLVDARAAFVAGVAAESREDRPAAIRHYHDSARLYLPGSPYVRDSLDRLEAIAAHATAAGETALARAALEAERGALLGARSLYTPHALRLPEVERQLARLLAVDEDHAVAPGADLAARTAWHAERLARRPGPALPYVVMALLGLGLWLGASMGFFSKGLDADLRLRRRPAAIAGVAFAVGMAVFLIGLRLA